MKIAANGTVNYLTYFGDTTRDSLVDLTLQGGSVYLLGNSCSVEPPVTCGRTFIAQIAADGTTVQRAVRVDGLNSYAFGVDVRSRAYVIGYAEPPLATTPDAFQSSADFIGSPMLVVLTLDSASPAVQYASYLGGGGPLPHTVRIDGAGGIVYGGQFNHNDGHLGTPIVNAPFASTAPGGVVIHVVPESRMVDNVGREIVIYAADVATMRGNWRLEEDASAAHRAHRLDRRDVRQSQGLHELWRQGLGLAGQRLWSHQIVLSSGRYVTASPGALKNDTTILPKTQ
jgi:hypothetical protein